MTGGFDSKQRIAHLRRAIERDYFPHLHRDGPEDDKKLLSRGVAAIAVRILTGCSIVEAAKCGTDGSQDDGMDAIAFNSEAKRIYVVQAKWHDAGNKVIDVGEAHKFLDGVDALRAGRLHPQNRRGGEILQRLRPILNTPKAKIVAVVAATSDREIDENVDAVLSKRMADVETMSREQLRLSDLHRQIMLDAESPSPTVEAKLLEWRQFLAPYKAIYGRIPADHLAMWYERHGAALFADNLRTALGSTDVNESIYRTLVRDPQKFWYFNNGITVLCKDWPQAPGISGDGTIFSFTDVSVVNGAQTVTQAHRAWLEKPAAVEQATVAVRFIALADSPEELGPTVTYTANSQNRVYPKDYLALEPEQVRIRREFRLTYDREYKLRTTDGSISREEGCSVEEAVAAQACSTSVELSCLSKTMIASLWESTAAAPYKKLFHWRTSVSEIWHKVQVLRLVDDALNSVDASLDEVKKAVAVHGNRLIAHAVFECLDMSKVSHIDVDWQPQLDKVVLLVPRLLEHVTSEVSKFMAERNLEINNQKKIARIVQDQNSAAAILHNVLREVDRPDPDFGRPKFETREGEPLFILRTKGALAHGQRCGGGFLVRAGALALAKDTPSLAPRYREARRNFVDSLVFIPRGVDKFVLTRDELFDSASDAANVIKGVQTNGPVEWRTENDMPYGEWISLLRTAEAAHNVE